MSKRKSVLPAEYGALEAGSVLPLVSSKKRRRNKMFVCNEDGCKFVTPNFDALTKHMLKHIKELRFVCAAEGCDFAASRNSQLMKHMRTHIYPNVNSFAWRRAATMQQLMVIFLQHTCVLTRVNWLSRVRKLGVTMRQSIAVISRLICFCTRVSDLSFAWRWAVPSRRQQTMVSNVILELLT